MLLGNYRPTPASSQHFRVTPHSHPHAAISDTIRLYIPTATDRSCFGRRRHTPLSRTSAETYIKSATPRNPGDVPMQGARTAMEPTPSPFQGLWSARQPAHTPQHRPPRLFPTAFSMGLPSSDGPHAPRKGRPDHVGLRKTSTAGLTGRSSATTPTSPSPDRSTGRSSQGTPHGMRSTPFQL